MNDEKRWMDLDWLVEIAKRLAVEYEETHFMAFAIGGKLEVQVDGSSDGLLEIAPLMDWEWVDRENDEIPHRAIATFRGVKFTAIFTDAERARIEQVAVGGLSK